MATYTKISPKIVNLRRIAGNAEEEQQWKEIVEITSHISKISPRDTAGERRREVHTTMVMYFVAKNLPAVHFMQRRNSGPG